MNYFTGKSFSPKWWNELSKCTRYKSQQQQRHKNILCEGNINSGREQECELLLRYCTVVWKWYANGNDFFCCCCYLCHCIYDLCMYWKYYNENHICDDVNEKLCWALAFRLPYIYIYIYISYSIYNCHYHSTLSRTHSVGFLIPITSNKFRINSILVFRVVERAPVLILFLSLLFVQNPRIHRIGWSDHYLIAICFCYAM